MSKSCRHRRLHDSGYIQASDRGLYKSWKRSYMRTSNLQARREGEDEIVSYLLNMGSGYGYDTVHVEAEMKAGGTFYDTQTDWCHVEDSYYSEFQTSFGDYDDHTFITARLAMADAAVGDMFAVSSPWEYEPYNDKRWLAYQGVDCVGEIILDNEHLQWKVNTNGSGVTESIVFDYLDMSLEGALRLIKVYTAIVNNYRHEDVPF